MNILILAHNRPRSFKKLLKQCLSIKNAQIWISIDKGSCNNNIKVIEIAKENKESHLIHLQVSDKNLGVRDGVYFGIDWFFNNVDEGVILEEDLKINNIALINLDNRISYKEFDVINLSCFDKQPIQDNSFNLSRVPDFYMWGWVSNKDIWDEFKTYRLNYIFDYFPHNFFLKLGPLYYFQWVLTAHLLKRGDIDSWGYRFLFFVIFKNKLVFRTSPPVAINNGLDEGANYSRFTLKKSELVSMSKPELLNYDSKLNTNLYKTELSNSDFKYAHNIRHNITFYQTIKAFFWIIFPFRSSIKNIFK